MDALTHKLECLSAFHGAACSIDLLEAFLAAVIKGTGHFAVIGMPITRENRGGNLSSRRRRVRRTPVKW